MNNYVKKHKATISGLGIFLFILILNAFVSREILDLTSHSKNNITFNDTDHSENNELEEEDLEIVFFQLEKTLLKNILINSKTAHYSIELPTNKVSIGTHTPPPENI